VTVVEKVQDHENNKDADETNDAYVTDLTFALVVTPSTENGDDLIVKVLDANGKSVAEGRIAGEAKEGENVLFADERGNYTFSGITLVEGNQSFNITLEGVQNLQEGVYLYSSEVCTDDSGDETTSQTMVGLASGKRAVNVEMNICFELSVEDEVVARERYRRTENNDNGEETPGEEIPDGEVPLSDIPKEIPEEDIPMEELPDEAVPLAEIPKTGDVSALWYMMSLFSGMGLVVLGKKREDGEA